MPVATGGFLAVAFASSDRAVEALSDNARLCEESQHKHRGRAPRLSWMVAVQKIGCER